MRNEAMQEDFEITEAVKTLCEAWCENGLGREEMSELVRQIEAVVREIAESEKEQIFAVTIGERGEASEPKFLALGEENDVEANIAEVLDGISEKKFVVFFHNHPGGSSDPSQKDIEAVFQIGFAMETRETKPLDHVIVGEKSLFSFAKSGLWSLKDSEGRSVLEVFADGLEAEERAEAPQEGDSGEWPIF